MFLALANFSFAQVQIEEEIVLDSEINSDAEFLTMPFFGIIEGSANGGALYHGLLKLVGISAGDQSVARGVSTCSASWQANAGWDIQNVAAGTPVIVRAYICDNGSPAQYVETATEKIVTGVNKYTIRFQDRNGAWRDATTLEFIEQTPPECPQANGNYCTSFTSSLPQITPQNMVGIYTSSTGCSEPGTVAFFDAVDLKDEQGKKALRSSHFKFNIGSIDVCFDKQRQIWNFKIIEPQILFPYVIEFCYNNLNVLNLNLIDINGIINLPSSECSLLLASYLGHKVYPRAVPEHGYIFYENTQFHEQAHRQLWLDYINEYISISGYNDFLDNYNFTIQCNDITDIEIAKDQFLTDFNKFFYNNLLDPMYKKYEYESGQLKGVVGQEERHKKEEARADNDPVVQASLLAVRAIILLKCWI